MRNACRSLLFHSSSRIRNQSPKISFFNYHHLHQLQVRHFTLQNPNLFSSFLTQNNLLPIPLELNCSNPLIRSFSSESAVLRPNNDHDQILPLIDIFSKSNGPDEIRAGLESANLQLNHDVILSALRNLDESPDVARRLFGWVSEIDGGKLSSKSYNLMLGILGQRRYRNEFWNLIEVMKKKGYGVSRNTCNKVSEEFSKEGLGIDVQRLKELYNTRPSDDSVKSVSSKICKVIGGEDEWGRVVEEKLEEMSSLLSGDSVALVVEQIGVHPMKALMFFRWLKGNPSFELDAKVYNAIIGVLGREDCIDEFWGIVNEMKDGGFEMEMATYFKVSGRFFKRKMMKDAVDLYEFVMSNGSRKPPVQDCLYLLRKIATANEPDMDLFSRVLRVFTEGGNILAKSLYDGVLKSLTGAGKLGEHERILKAMEEWGFSANSDVYSDVIFGHCRVKRFDEACEYLDRLESSGRNPDSKVWASLIQGHCLAGEVEKASSCFKNMVEKKDVSVARYAFEVLVRGFCAKNREKDAYELLVRVANAKEFKPFYSSYKILIEKLLVGGFLKEATDLLVLMRSHGFKPSIGLFINHISKTGTADDAMSVLKATKEKRFPPTSVFLQMFKAFFKANRRDVAHDFLSRTPRAIRSHSEVLELFKSMKPKVAESATLAVS